MKSKSKRSIAFIILVLLIALSQFFVNVSFANTNSDLIAGKFKYGPALGTIDRTGTYYYRDSYFNKSGKVLNSHLRTMSLNLALATFQSAHLNGDYANGSQNIQKLLNEIDFEDIEINDDFKVKQTEDTVGVIIGRKKINGKNLMVVSVRGVGYGAEWINNFTIGKEGYAKGFEKSANKVTACIRNYQEKYQINNTKIWIMGYSRSSAIVDVVGAKVNENLELYHTTADDVYIYAFGTPNAVTLDSVKYENIHNTISREDFFTYIPGRAWGLTRSGVDDTIIPSKGSSEYNALYPEFKRQFKLMDTERNYVEDDFAEKYLSLELGEENPIVIKDVENTRTQSQFVKEFFEFLQDEEKFLNKGKLTREDYATNLEPYIKDLLSVVMGKTTDEQNEIINYFSVIGTDIVSTLKDEVSRGDYENVLSLLTFIGGEIEQLEETGVLEKVASIVINSIERTERPDALGENEIETIKNSISPLLKFLQPVVREDFLAGNGGSEGSESYMARRIASVVNNVSLLIQPHLPEVTLAWMRAMDTYYTTDEIKPGKTTPIDTKNENFAGATLGKIKESVLNSLLTKEEKELVKLGNNAYIYLVANELGGNLVSDEDKELINNAMGPDMKLGFYMNIDLLKKIGNRNPVKITRIGEKIKITIQIPDTLLGKEYYKIILVHDGKAEIINAEINGNLLTFETDKFSTYALIYKEKSEKNGAYDDTIYEENVSKDTARNASNPMTGDNIVKIVSIFAIVALGAFITLILNEKCKKKKNPKIKTEK